MTVDYNRVMEELRIESRNIITHESIWMRESEIKQPIPEPKVKKKSNFQSFLDMEISRLNGEH
jgi:hypothetical protein